MGDNQTSHRLVKKQVIALQSWIKEYTIFNLVIYSDISLFLGHSNKGFTFRTCCCEIVGGKFIRNPSPRSFVC